MPVVHASGSFRDEIVHTDVQRTSHVLVLRCDILRYDLRFAACTVSCLHECTTRNAYRRCSLPFPISPHPQWRVRQKQRQEKKKRRKKGKAGGGGKVRQYAGVESLSGRVEKGEHGSTGTTGTAAKWGVDGRIMAKTKLVYMRP